MARRLIISRDQFEVKTGETYYEVPLPAGDCQVDYTIMADGEVALYAGFEGKVVPIDHGTKLNGVLYIKDAEMLAIRTARKGIAVAIQVFHAERRLTDINDGKPLAVHVPTPPKMDLQQMMMRMVGQKPEHQLGDLELTPEEIQEQFPDDVDTEFGPGYVQLEEDEDIIDALRQRETNTKKGKGSADSGEEGKGSVVRGKQGGAKKREEPPKPPAPEAEDGKDE